MIVLPQFNIDSAKIHEQLHKLLTMLKQQLEDLLHQAPTRWNDLIPVLEELGEKLQQFWSPIAHLHAVKSTPALRHAYQACLPLLTEYSIYLQTNEKLYQAYLKVQKNELNAIQQQLVNLALRDFRLSGVHLSAEDKIRYAEIEQALSKFEAKFSENVLDATQAFRYVAKEKEMLVGIPLHALKQDKEGLLLTLDQPSYLAVMQYAQNRSLRETFYHAHVTRASEWGNKKWDNTKNIQQILAQRLAQAKLLGFENYAQLSLASKMAQTPPTAEAFLMQLVAAIKPAAEKEFTELAQFAGHALMPWDVSFYSEKLKKERYDFSEEQLRQYFPLKKVLAGLFALMQKVFLLTMEEVSGLDTWHPDVRVFKISDKNNNTRGYFYMDLYVRPDKKEGAWMDDFCSRRKLPDGELQIPVAYLTCNFSPPDVTQQSFLTHDDVVTLFHEFGHTIHHLLTTIDYVDVAGIHGVPWDAVEFPSQWMEQWCWQPDVLVMISEAMPKALMEKLIQSRIFHNGLHFVRQLEFALVDLKLHQQTHELSSEEVLTIARDVNQKVAVIHPPEYFRQLNTFAHLFDGSYAAGYYSYLWAEVLSVDAFGRFIEEGIFNPQVGEDFLTHVLSQGGSQEPLDLFTAFRGRKPDPKALLMLVK